MTSTISSLPSPISVSTSQAWDSDTLGTWSSFIVQVGTPPQPARVLVSTASGETWVVVPEGCPATYGPNCADLRGELFLVENSTTWSNISLFELDLELNLDYNGNGEYGHDVVTLGYPGSGGPSLTQRVVAGIAAPDFWLGIFGLDPAPSNFTSSMDDPQPSFLDTLANNSMIPSLSWGYTAGAAYRYDKTQGSLTLGGYDSSRFAADNVTFDMYQDVSRRFIVNLNTVTYTPTGGSTPGSTITLMPGSLPMSIDSTIPFIYLPIPICTIFESTFGLQWDSVSKLYTINETAHNALQNLNPNITFALENSASQTVNVTLPYSAFDLTATFPTVANDTNYFPLRRAANDSQYTLGRVFLQEAYLIADYERSTFTIAPCVWPPTFKEDIVAILPISASSSSSLSSDPTVTPHAHRTPTATIAGGIAGCVILIIFCFVLGHKFFYKPRHKKAVETPGLDTAMTGTAGSIDEPFAKPELDAKDTEYHVVELAVSDKGDQDVEMQAAGEIDGRPVRGHELDGKAPVRSELASQAVYEMPAREAVGTELGPSPGFNPPAWPWDEKPKHRTYYNP